VPARQLASPAIRTIRKNWPRRKFSRHKWYKTFLIYPALIYPALTYPALTYPRLDLLRVMMHVHRLDADPARPGHSGQAHIRAAEKSGA
jgi:hypothetical protein